jgi:hypothetical protein
METIPLFFETYGAGNQNLYANISGMDLWVENSMLPHCSSVNGNATCDLGVESDMPRVVSQDGAEGGLDGTSLTIGILAMLLIGATFAIIVLMRRERSDDSIFYDDDEWEEDEDADEDEDSLDQTANSILTPTAPEKSALDSASEILASKEGSGDQEIAETQISDNENDSGSEGNSPEKQEEPVEESEQESDPWANVEHSE